MSHDVPSFEDEHRAGLHLQYPHAACLLCVDEESQKKTNAAFESLTKRISELEEIVSLLEQERDAWSYLVDCWIEKSWGTMKDDLIEEKKQVLMKVISIYGQEKP